MDLPVLDTARVGFVARVDRRGQVPDGLLFLLASLAGDGLDRLVPVRHLGLRVGAHVVVPAMSAYQDSKLAVLRLMEFVSREYAGKGVIAFVIHPGNIPTDIVGGPEGLSDVLKPGKYSPYDMQKYISSFLNSFC